MVQAKQPETDHGTLVKVHGLVKRFAPKGRLALDGVEADIRRGEVTGLVGPDGAGKTTLIRILAGLLEPTEGEVRVLGYDPVSEAEEIHLRIGYMPQRFGLYEDLSVLQNLQLYADLRGVAEHARPEIFEHLLTFTDLKRFSDWKAGNLSGGMKQNLDLPAPWSASRSCCFSMNQALAWTPSHAENFGGWCRILFEKISAWSGVPRIWTRRSYVSRLSY